MKNPLNYHEFNRQFRWQYPNHMKLDKVARRTLWNDTLDKFHKKGIVSDRCLNWGHPHFLKLERVKP